MESSTEKTISKQLVAEDLKINPDIEGAANCEKKEIPSEIDQEKAQRDELKPVIEAMTTYNTGLQSGAENSTNLSAIMRETREIPGALVTKDEEIQQRQPSVAATDVLQVQKRMLEGTSEETVRYQEHDLDTIVQTREFLMLGGSIEEFGKVVQELENTQRDIGLFEHMAKKEGQELLDSFIEQAIDIDKEQEQLDEEQAQLAAKMLNFVEAWRKHPLSKKYLPN